MDVTPGTLGVTFVRIHIQKMHSKKLNNTEELRTLVATPRGCSCSVAELYDSLMARLSFASVIADQITWRDDLFLKQSKIIADVGPARESTLRTVHVFIAILTISEDELLQRRQFDRCSCVVILFRVGRYHV